MNVDVLEGMLQAFAFEISDLCPIHCEPGRSTFNVTLKANGVWVGRPFNVLQPAGEVIFIGVYSDTPFNRIEIAELDGSIDNDPYGNFYVDGAPVECEQDDDCSDDGNECTDTVCSPAGMCTHPNSAAGTPCQDDGDECTADECLDGACIHPTQPVDGQPCGDSTDDECTDPDTCLNGVCNANHAPAGTVCGDVGDECGGCCL